MRPAVTCREEVFMDLSLEIEQNSSLTSCLRNFRQVWPAAGHVEPCACSAPSATPQPSVGLPLMLQRLAFPIFICKYLENMTSTCM